MAGVKSGKQFVAEPDGNVVAVNESEVPVILKVAIPPDLFSEYEELASSQQLTVAELILDRMKRCKDHSSIRSLYFSESLLRQLEVTLQKRPIGDPAQALTLIQSALSVRVGDLPPVQISAQQAKRLALSAYGGQSIHDRLSYIVQGAIAKATGI